MNKIDEFKKHAAECRQMARSASADTRAALERMAETWESLAANREHRNRRGENQTINKQRD